MRGRTKLISLAATLSIVMIVSAAFATRIVDVSTLSLFNTGFEPDSPGTNVFVDPAKTIRDYVNNPTYRRGNIIQLSINLTTDVVTDLYAYQIDVTWNPAVLNFSNVHVYGDLLARTGSPYGTSRIEPTWTANNTAGSASIAEAILGDYPGITGSGRLVTLNFTVNGYGWSNITITVGGDLPTMLLNSAGTQLSFTMTIGYFDNKLRGDVTGDRVVNINDMSAIGLAFGATPARLTWNYNADLNKDNVININDMSEVGLNFGRQTSLP